MSISAAEEDRLWKEILEEQGLPLDVPLLSALEPLEWPPKNTTPATRHRDYVLRLERAGIERQQMGADVYDKMLMESQKRLTKIFKAEEVMKVRMEELKKKKKKMKTMMKKKKAEEETMVKKKAEKEDLALLNDNLVAEKRKRSRIL